jgi:hypothetical protein
MNNLKKVDSNSMKFVKKQHEIIPPIPFTLLLLRMMNIEVIDNLINKECIPLRERIGSWFYNSFHCTNSDTSYVERL